MTERMTPIQRLIMNKLRREKAAASKGIKRPPEWNQRRVKGGLQLMVKREGRFYFATVWREDDKTPAVQIPPYPCRSLARLYEDFDRTVNAHVIGLLEGSESARFAVRIILERMLARHYIMPR